MKKLTKIKLKVCRVITFIMILFATQSITTISVPAKNYSNADLSEVTSGIDIIKDICLAVVGGIGFIYLVMGIVDFATTYSSHDTTQQMQGIKKVIAGIIIIAIPVIIKLFT